MNNRNFIDIGLLIIRASLGILMLLHGINKLGGIPFIEKKLIEIGLPAFIAYGVYIGEIIAPILIIIGFRTRIAALIFAFNCLVAVLLVHSSDIFSLNKHGAWAIELLGLYFFVSLALFFMGGGKYSISSKSVWD